MPFCAAVKKSRSNCILLSGRTFKEKRNKKIVTLQVRILSNSYFKRLIGCCGKKVFLSVPGALTLEAAMCLTLFIFASVCLMLPMKVMNTERKIQAVMEMIGEDYSRYAYLKQAIEAGNTSAAAGARDSDRKFGSYVSAGIGEGYALAQISDRVDTRTLEHGSILRSKILTDGETIDLVFDYEIRLPFPVLGIPAWKRTARCCRRAWIGKDGKDYDRSGNRTETSANQTVYVGRDSTRYHKDRGCHYLSNQITAVSKEQVSELRSQNGGKYHPCAICGSHASGLVYIMPSGERYHSDPGCSAITAYVRAAKLEEVEHLGPCSYCSK